LICTQLLHCTRPLDDIAACVNGEQLMPNTQHTADMALLRRVFIVVAVGATLAIAGAPDSEK
jgi:hypothetical protein